MLGIMDLMEFLTLPIYLYDANWLNYSGDTWFRYEQWWIPQIQYMSIGADRDYQFYVMWV